MNKFVIGSLLATLAIPAAASAQQATQSAVIVVDTQRIYAECTACKAAQTQLQAQATALQQRAQQLEAPIRTEAQAIQTAAAGKAPDPALQKRLQTLQAQQNTANQEISGRQETIQRNQAFVVQQINARMGPIVQQIMQSRGATVVIERGAALSVAPSVDVTGQVLASLNQQLPSVSVTAPAAPAQQQQPQGR